MSGTSARVPPPDPADVLRDRQLIEFTRFYADEVASGKYPYVEFDEDERWHQRIYRDPRVDIWLISWLPDAGHRAARPRRLVRLVHRAVPAS